MYILDVLRNIVTAKPEYCQKGKTLFRPSCHNISPNGSTGLPERAHLNPISYLLKCLLVHYT